MKKDILVHSGRYLRHAGAAVMYSESKKFEMSAYVAAYPCECLQLGIKQIYESGWTLVAVSDGIHYFEGEKDE